MMKTTITLKPEYHERLLASEVAEFLAGLPEGTTVELNKGWIYSLDYDSEKGTVEIWVT